MTYLVFFLEERSAEEMLNGILPKILPEDTHYECVVFEGKQDLEKRLPKRLRGWLHTEETKFIVLRDQDSADCRQVKTAYLKYAVQQANRKPLSVLPAASWKAFIWVIWRQSAARLIRAIWLHGSVLKNSVTLTD